MDAESELSVGPSNELDDSPRYDRDELTTSVSSPDATLRYVLVGRAVESVSVVTPVSVKVPVPVPVQVPVPVRGEKVENE